MTSQSTPEPAKMQLHRLCVFDLWLECGHIATVAVNGWYPVAVPCCERLGGTILHGTYVPYSSHVEYVQTISERYEHQPDGTPRTPDRLLGRRPRTDQPYEPSHPWDEPTAGRYPARVGATWSIDGSTPPST